MTPIVLESESGGVCVLEAFDAIAFPASHMDYIFLHAKGFCSPFRPTASWIPSTLV